MMRRKRLDQAALAAVEFVLNENRLTDEDRVGAIRGVLLEHHKQANVRFILPAPRR